MATDYGSLPEIAQYSPYYPPLNVLLLPNDKIFIFYLIQINKHLQYTFWCSFLILLALFVTCFGVKKVQVGKDQEKAQSEKDPHSKNRGGKVCAV